jgi:hypothetical protein
MKSEQANREAQRIRELADEYEKKGYTVVHPRTEKDLPPFLWNVNYIPDLVVISDKEKLVVEVKTSKTVRRDKEMSRVSDLVNRQPGWQFLFVLTNPKSDASIIPAPNSARWHDLLTKSRHPALATPELVEAAFLLAWAALEGVLREATASDESLNETKSAFAKAPMSLVRDAAILGLIDRKDVPKLDTMFQMRNRIVHSIGGTSPSAQDVRDLQRLVDDVLQASRSSDEV